MREFRDDDAGYNEWLASNPGGFVVNLPRTGAAPRVLHRATCRTITGTSAEGLTWTAGQYIKWCFPDAAELLAAGSGETGTFVRCRICTPTPAATQENAQRSARTTSAGGVAQEADFSILPAVASSAPTVPDPSPGAPIVAAVQTPARRWHRWQQGNVLNTRTDIVPLLASWEKRTHPAQVKLQRYLDRVQEYFSGIIAGRSDLYLHVSVDVEKPERLSHHYDVENYLTPLIGRLGGQRFVFVSGEKHVGGGSSLTIGEARPALDPAALRTWEHFSCRILNDLTTTAGKDSLRQSLIDAGVAELPPEYTEIEVQIAWRCAPTSKWDNFWKPTGDAMGPVLGPWATRDTGNKRRFTPHDDRIVALQFHREIAETMGGDVEVGIWWRQTAANREPGEGSAPTEGAS